MPKISIKPEPVFHILGFTVTNSFFTSLIVMALFIAAAVYYKNQSGKEKRGTFYYFLNFIIKSVYNFFSTILGKNIDLFFPLVGSFFFYILLQNWFGLLPGVGSILIKIHEHGEELMVPLLRGNNADLNTTLALGLVAVIMVQVYSIKFVGIKEYLGRYINLKGPIDFFLGFLEIVSEISRVLSYSFRLFGNIFAGEVLLSIVAFLVPVLASFPFLMLEIFVGLVQALVFAMLFSVFLGMGIQKHH